MKKPADDVMHAINFRVNRAEMKAIIETQREMEEEFGASLPIAQVIRRMVRDYVGIGLTGKKAPR